MVEEIARYPSRFRRPRVPSPTIFAILLRVFAFSVRPSDNPPAIPSAADTDRATYRMMSVNSLKHLKLTAIFEADDVVRRLDRLIGTAGSGSSAGVPLILSSSNLVDALN
jgi:hypothetical protein